MAPPIGIYEGKLENGDNTVIADEIKDATKLFNESLGAPDWDREIRITSRHDDEPSTLRISYTVGDNEYPDSEDPSFRPTDSAVSETAGKIIDKIKQSGNADIDKLIIESWPDTTFKAYEQGDVGENNITEPESISGKKLADYVSDKSELKLVVPVGFEIDNAITNGGQKTIKQVFSEYLNVASPKAKEFFEGMTISVQIADEAEVDMSVEYDCELKYEDDKIPQDVREYMASAITKVIDKIKTGCVGEVWIRQGKPNTQEFLIS